MAKIVDFYDNMIVTEEVLDPIGQAANSLQLATFGAYDRSEKPLFSAYNVADRSVPGNQDYEINWERNGIEIDNTGMWNDVAPYLMTIRVPGLYRVSFTTSLSTGSGTPAAYVTENGSSPVDRSILGAASPVNSASGASSILSATRIKRFAAGRQLRLLLWTAGGGTLRGGTNWGSTNISVEFVAP